MRILGSGDGRLLRRFRSFCGRYREHPVLYVCRHRTKIDRRLQRDSAVYYRGIQVGVVQSVQLNQDASGVDITLFIWQQYAPLARASSKFWIESGFDVSGGLFSGLKLNLESLRALISGGVAFATPDDKSPQATAGAVFTLNDAPQKEWLAWEGPIPLPSDTSEEGDKESDNQPTPMQSVQKAVSK